MPPLKNLEKLEEGFSVTLQFTPGLLHEIRIGGQAELIKHVDIALDEIRIAILNEFLDQQVN